MVVVLLLNPETVTYRDRTRKGYTQKNGRVIDGGSGSTAAAATEAEAAAVATVATAARVEEIYERKMAAPGRAPNT